MKVALTFDAELPGREHWSASACESILLTLAHREVRATFFMQGRWANAEPALARMVVAHGHLVGAHGHHHVPMTALADPGDEVRRATQAIQRHAGVDPRPWWRSPNGLTDVGVAEAVAQHGYREVGWDVQLGDWEPLVSVPELVQGARDGVDQVFPRKDHAVILLHTWPASTAAALPQILDALKGSEFVTVADL